MATVIRWPVIVHNERHFAEADGVTVTQRVIPGRRLKLTRL